VANYLPSSEEQDKETQIFFLTKENTEKKIFFKYMYCIGNEINTRHIHNKESEKCDNHYSIKHKLNIST
jgi:hypothetical protein